MPRSNRCPRCGATVSQFAAGCAYCGADLERLRRRPAARVSRAIRTSPRADWPGGLADATLLTTVLVIVALFAPLFGMILALVIGWERNRGGHRALRNVAVICFFLALASFFTPLLAGVPRLEPVWHQH